MQPNRALRPILHVLLVLSVTLHACSTEDSDAATGLDGADGLGDDGASGETDVETGALDAEGDSLDAVNTSDAGDADVDCPLQNPAFIAGCEPVIASCADDEGSVLAESFRGAFGSVSPDGVCQSEWPDPWLASCTEPIADGYPDLRGLWADEGHVERIEQCGNLIIIVGDNYTHGGYVTGIPEDGVNDFRADNTCAQPIQVALRFEGNALQFVQGENVVVTRTLETAPDGSDELVWRFGPLLTELARMRRYCSLGDVPATASSGLPGSN
jgi:hypothetical protein